MDRMTTVKITAKKGREKIVALTAYDFFTARFLDSAGIDILLVGDSVNMVLYGKPNTLSATMDTMLAHTEAVASAAVYSLVVADMPFLSYQVSDEEAVRNAGRFLKESGAAAVKLEGGYEIAPLVSRLVNIGIPVLGHIGMQPQSYHKYGGYRLQGKTEESKEYLLKSARSLEGAGAFAVVLEKVEANFAKVITDTLFIPTIGIGSGPFCDGQILVVNDILGMFDEFKPRFARQYDDFKSRIKDAASRFAKDVREGKFPEEKESFFEEKR